MEIGQLVRVPVYGGEVVRRVVVQLFDNIVLVSTVQEAEDALRENRSPVAMGISLNMIERISE